MGNDKSSESFPSYNFQFSSDEIRVLRECSKESFFQRSIPLSSVFGLAAYFGVKKGFLKGNSKFGSIPKIILGVILGYFAGKFSYQQKCAEKLMRLPNSQLAEIIRQRQNGADIVERNTLAQKNSSTEFKSLYELNLVDQYSDTSGNEQLHSNWDNNQSEFQSYGFQSSNKQMSQTNLGKEAQSYEEMRRINREKYSKILQTQQVDKFGDSEEKKISEGLDSYGDTWTG